MGFFKKLKERLFKSSSKIDEGLDAIIEDGGEAEEVELEEGLKTQKETVEFATSVEAEIEPAPIDPKLEQNALNASETIEPEEVKENVDFDKIDDVEIEPVPIKPQIEQNEVANEKPTETKGKKETLVGKILGRKKVKVIKRKFDDDMLEQLEELLIASDMGVDTAMRVAANMAQGNLGSRLSTSEIKKLLADEIEKIMENVAQPLPIYPKNPQVVLVVGVNGSGKTTTIGKLASQFKEAGKNVVIAAGDTFRAAAVEQLQIWGDRANVPVLVAPEGSDPASLAFDALEKAQQEKADLLMIDTAGRLQNRTDLMEELAKIVRVLKKKDPEAPQNTILVLDATTGQNAISQVETFREIAEVSGLIMTKLDGTAKGGVLVALADKFGLPIHAIGVGEQIDDLAPFDPAEFAQALTGSDN
ncbi:MAG: signal recognition particle-docking protein FtsY [Rhodobacteraceae bacterium TMED111]|nr:signal recognition particle-docking protein FtsY [Marinovum sp.]OUV40975.1 MAG: signal recognition particle-docking protein FtsY [Rhodobacteraceae bacterium TMED111]